MMDSNGFIRIIMDYYGVHQQQIEDYYNGIDQQSRNAMDKS